jgi:hypothetical protein
MWRTFVPLLGALLAACSGAAHDGTQSADTSKPVGAPAHEHEAPLPQQQQDSAPLPSMPAAPPNVPVTHVTPIASIADTACTFELLSTSLPDDGSGIPRWSVSVMKTDTHPGSCTSHTGAISLVTQSYEQPTGALALVADTKMLAVTFDGQFAPTAVVYTRLVQIDYDTGQLLHEGEMVVQGTPLWPPPPALRPTGLQATANDVVLTGTGDFPGAGGGTKFVATFTDFLGVDRQLPSPATSAIAY